MPFPPPPLISATAALVGGVAIAVTNFVLQRIFKKAPEKEPQGMSEREEEK